MTSSIGPNNLPESPSENFPIGQRADRQLSQITSLMEHLDEAGGRIIAQDTTRIYEDRLVQARLGLASGLFTALRCKHAGTAAHSLRVALGCSSWALAMKLPEADRDQLEIAALLHDIGKIGVPDGILLKPGRLTDDELVIMDRHRAMGLEILRSCCASPYVLDVVTYAPAWFDGSRGNNRLRGKDLPIGARMIAIADAFDSMTTDHVYRPAMSRERAMAELCQFSGSQFDPELIKQFCKFDGELREELSWKVMQRWLHTTSPEVSHSLWRLNEALGVSSPLVPEDLFSEKLLDNMHDGVVFVDGNLQISLWNRGAERLTGIAGPSVLQRPFTPSLLAMRDEEGILVHDRDCPVAYAIASGTQLMRRLLIAGRNANSVVVDAHAIPVISPQGVTYGAMLILHDASSQISLEQRCQRLYEEAIRDPLTQLANRAEFDRALESFVSAHLELGLPCSLIICDIDRFKQVNDNYGHPAGDEVIKSFAGLLKSCCRPGDVVARYGGEEFVMLCADCTNAVAARRAESLRVAFADLPQSALGGKAASASFGVTELQPGDNVETMLRRADRALLMAKDGGRNAVVQLGSGIGQPEQKPKTRRWWSGRLQNGPKFVVERNLVTSVPLEVAIEKLRGFVADHHAEITLIEANRVHLKLDGGRTPLLRRSTDRSVPFCIELEFTERSGLNSGGSQPTASRPAFTKVFVSIHPLRQRDRRHENTLQRARQVLTSLRAYLMAIEDESDTSPKGLSWATSKLMPWRQKRTPPGDSRPEAELRPEQKS